MSHPEFSGLVRFLIEPFLDSPDSLKIDCEENEGKSKVWIRVAFSEEERGKVFGRGGRNVQAIRNVLRATAALSGWSAYFDVYGGNGAEGSSGRSSGPPRKRSSRPSKPRPARSDKSEE
jgi:predicted RNA-binding protein YlqC (UPF0109 family)